MVKIKRDAFFPDKPSVPIEDAEKSVEKRKISYWLEKLHAQGERVLNRPQAQIKNDPGEQPVAEEFSSLKDQAITESGINEHTKNVATKKEEDIQNVNDLVKMSNRRIISISSLFPWDLFPNTIDVEESKVIFKFNQLLSSQSHSLDIKDISNIFIETSLFFATLQVVSRTFVQNDIKIGKLNKSKAIKVQGIIEGLRTFAENNINTSHYEVDELISKIEEFHTNNVVE